MIYESIVTSVPRGLQAGRTGFTTVLRTRGMHPELGNRLEAASGYRHVYPQGDARNPQIRSHVVVQTPVGPVSVLSRIVDAGNDYSGRSNKLAHHVALDAGEVSSRIKSSPAAVLQQLERANGFQRAWQGEPREQPAGPFVPVVPVEPGPCVTWSRVAGDAGWAGLLADRAIAKEPTWIIAPPGVDLVELFAEALAMVNYHQRWGVTFTTYALTAGDALWLGTLDGSPESQAARGQSRIAVVDLVRRPALTSQSPLITAARSGGAVPWKREAVAVAASSVASPAAALGGVAPTGPATATLESAMGGGGKRPPPVGGRPPSLGPGVAGGIDPYGIPEALPGYDGLGANPPQGRSWLVPALVVGVLAMLAVCGGIVATNPGLRGPLVALFGGDEAPGQDAVPESPAPDARERAVPPPSPAPRGDTKFASDAESHATAACEQRDKIKALGGEANGLLTEVSGPSLTAFKDDVDRTRQAIDAGRSTQKAVEDAEEKRKTLAGKFARLSAIKSEAAAAAAAARQAQERADQAVADAKREQAPEGVVRKASAAAAQAKEACQAAEQDVQTFASVEALLVEPRKAFDAAESELKGVRGQIDAARTAFAALKARLEAARHVPTQSISPTSRAELCAVGDARIEIDLPTEEVQPSTNSRLVCRRRDPPPEATDKTTDKAPGDARGIGPTWDVLWTGPQGNGVPIGILSIANDTLWVERVVAADNPLLMAHDAFACSVLRIRDAYDARAADATPPPESVAFVQLTRPIEAGPIVIKKMFQPEAGSTNYPGRQEFTVKVGQDLAPWPASWKPAFILESAACEKLVGEIDSAARPVPPPDNGDIPGPTPVTWSIAWKWGKDAVVITDLTFEITDAPQGLAMVKVVGGRLQPPWNTRRRLVPLKPGDGGAFGGFPDEDRFEAQTTKVAAKSLNPLASGIVDTLLQDVKEPKVQAAVRRLRNLPESFDAPLLPLADWSTFLRVKAVAATPAYQAWARNAFPVHRLGDKPSEGDKQKHKETQAALDRALKGDPAAVGRFRDAQEKKVGEDDFDAWDVLLLCRLSAELEEVAKGKAEVKKLLEEAYGYEFTEAVGGAAKAGQKEERKQPRPKNEHPDATLTGDIGIDFPSINARSVLVSFRAEKPEKQDRKPGEQSAEAGGAAPVAGGDGADAAAHAGDAASDASQAEK